MDTKIATDSRSPLEGEQASPRAVGGKASPPAQTERLDPSRFSYAESALPQGEGKVAERKYAARTLGQAKMLRQKMTDAERKLWKCLRARQLERYKFRKQQPIGSYIVDFVCQQYRLIIEVDGGQHAENLRDEKRTVWLEAQGYHVLRFWNNDVLKDTQAVVGTILMELQAIDSPSL